MPPRTAPAYMILALFLGLALLVASGGGQAQPANAGRTAAAGLGNPVFVVSNVAVDANADSSAAARPIALQDGQRRAFTLLLRRLTLPEDRARLPQPSEALLNDTIAGFEIDEERTSATRYLGRITVRFRPDAVRALLQNLKLGYAEVMSRPLLLLPVWQTPEGARLWEADNPWREALRRRPETDGMVPLLLAEPASGPDALPVDRLLADPGQLQALANRRQAGNALVVAASLVAQEGSGVRLEILPYYAANDASPDHIEAFVSAGATLDEALNAAANELVRRIESRWKRATRLDLDKPGQLSAAAGFRSLADWIRLRDRLAEVPAIRRTDVLRLTHRDAQIQLDFYGEPAQLAVALAQKEVDLRQREGFWELSLKPAAKR
ncbi:DUF2066 domain-containing protein [Ferrovibrio sp.]|uniref:DUF2066 domain-containing protein n=1 Tax=Ferrovibrio sp. TaxID=1917215 RepID=UPI001B5E4134|nr:DUF2066 domain-containing protein [Ferrovibrio sp.]MBP7064588.1 hypothetical protein [Ferrovibrio sp.]